MKQGIVFRFFHTGIFSLVIMFSTSDVVASKAGGGTNALGEIKCSAGAFVIDPDPAGLNVRTKPKGKVITRLPTDAAVDLVAYHKGWFKISHATYPDGGGFAKRNEHRLKDGDEWVELKDINGWVYSKMLGTSIASYGSTSVGSLLSEPSYSAKMVAKIPGGDELHRIQVLECRGKWLKIRLNGRDGWLKPELNCPNPWTTCS